jgi:hypothetical protein
MTQKKRDDAIRDTFPASDPPPNTGDRGTRAVPVQDLAPTPAPRAENGVALSARFASAEAAKLALEALVREGPIPREHAAMEPGSDGVVLTLHVPAGDRGRLKAILDRQSGSGHSG